MTTEEKELNLYDVPLLALKVLTRQAIICELNKKKVLPSDNELPRDYRGMAHLTEIILATGDNPACQLLREWEKKGSANLGLLEEYLGVLDRFDILDDMKERMRADAMDYIQRRSAEFKSNEGEKVKRMDELILTSDDISQLDRGLPLQAYDALVLYADEDFEFAYEMMGTLRNEFKLNTCLKEDLVAGQYLHEGMIRLISERCGHVIIIITPDFISSRLEHFIVTFSQAMAIDQRRRIIIPVLYGGHRVVLPAEINYLCKLDHNRVQLKNYNFWKRLNDAVVTPAMPCEMPREMRKLELASAISMPDIYEKMAAMERVRDPALVDEVEAEAQARRERKLLASNNADSTCHLLARSTLDINHKKPKKSVRAFLHKLFQPDPKNKLKKMGVKTSFARNDHVKK